MEKLTERQKKIKQQALYKYQNDYNATHYKRCNISFTMDIYNALQAKADSLNISVIDYIRKLITDDLRIMPEPIPEPGADSEPDSNTQ